MTRTAGRFAPSPTGDLHLGNLRTALASWLHARAAGSAWLVRFEDLDQVVADRQQGQRQLDDLAALGMVPDREPLWQSDHRHRYDAVIAGLVESGHTYPCFCTRREIRAAIAAAASAPNGAVDDRYPGTCAGLSVEEQRRRRSDRPPALRLRSAAAHVDFDDDHYGPQRHPLDDFVIRRSDGVAAYNLVVVVDDHTSGVGTVVRAADLLPSTARQLALVRVLGYAEPRYAHVPLVVNHRGERLAKRDGAVTLADLGRLGWRAEDILGCLARSMGLLGSRERAALPELVARWGNDRPSVSTWRNRWSSAVTAGGADPTASPGFGP